MHQLDVQLFEKLTPLGIMGQLILKATLKPCHTSQQYATLRVWRGLSIWAPLARQSSASTTGDEKNSNLTVNQIPHQKFTFLPNFFTRIFFLPWTIFQAIIIVIYLLVALNFSIRISIRTVGYPCQNTSFGHVSIYENNNVLTWKSIFQRNLKLKYANELYNQSIFFYLIHNRPKLLASKYKHFQFC